MSTRAKSRRKKPRERRRKPQPRRPPEVYEPDEVAALIRSCSRRAPTGCRNAALIVLCYRAGLRISEALALLPKDVDLKTGRVVVLHGKGDRSRTVALGPGDVALIERWVQKRRGLKCKPSQPLICTLNGGQLDSSYVRQLLPRLGRRAGLSKRIHAHGLRHTLAYEMHVKERQPVALVQKVLGHSNLATTAVYLSHIAPRDVLDAMRNRPAFVYGGRSTDVSPSTEA